ncbi:uncharacterized protein LOC122090704 isoform X2 [Macadamia integrifolia]|uniref:uncharacterized protein LOC122090704 isoform X2 n=1 Tax=Macadamia integrifolia TaxID=60698 RepID=UPI001C4FF6FC|nr:uncharacterized protein LOC122090704 isoform X2 [Macadamia integrifolia]
MFLTDGFSLSAFFKKMGPSSQKTLERIISQKALQMSSSFPCQICVVGFLLGVCLTYFFMAALTSWVEFGGASFLSHSPGLPSQSLTSHINETKRRLDSQRSDGLSDDAKVSLLYSAWTNLINESLDGKEEFSSVLGLSRSSVPKAPHLENCKLSTQLNEKLDKRGENGSLLPWTNWKGWLSRALLHPLSAEGKQGHFDHRAQQGSAYPPWILGSDEDNFPSTRKVQRDIWIHQHPLNCSDPNIRFLVADWEKLPGFGIGAQLAGMCGLLAIAINERRVLVTNYFNRADHDGCKGPLRSHWSCYFFPETSMECRDRAFELMGRPEAWEKGIVTVKDNYTSKEIWAGRIPRVWGNPWSFMQPTTEINGRLVIYHHKMDRRWWRAQAVRYLMRFQSEYACGLMNVARHTAFGLQAAKMVLAGLVGRWPQVVGKNSQSDMEEYVWSNHKPWVPRPLLSMHVRMGDKACEMKVVDFEEYMRLADRIRKRFPDLNNIWLSTEMQEVIDKSRLYPHWTFYYTDVTRQVGNMTMASYESSLGRETSTNYPLVNFLMASEADFFVGALGSTWCFLIDGMRNTGGKVMSGYLSVNKDRFW